MQAEGRRRSRRDRHMRPSYRPRGVAWYAARSGGARFALCVLAIYGQVKPLHRRGGDAARTNMRWVGVHRHSTPYLRRCHGDARRVRPRADAAPCAHSAPSLPLSHRARARAHTHTTHTCTCTYTYTHTYTRTWWGVRRGRGRSSARRVCTRAGARHAKHSRRGGERGDL